MFIGIDFETWAPVSIKDVGLDNYVNHQEFMVTLCSIARPNQPVQRFDLIRNPEDEAQLWDLVFELDNGRRGPQPVLAAHNAGFEIATIRRMTGSTISMVDTAVLSRIYGGESALVYAAPQLLGISKLDDDRALLKEFALSPEAPSRSKLDEDQAYQQRWEKFGEYCDRDAELTRDLAIQAPYGNLMPSSAAPATLEAWTNVQPTYAMNTIGWPVDLELVEVMKEQVERNTSTLHHLFRTRTGIEDFNFNSFKQKKEFCERRGIKVTSFDERNVQRVLAALTKRLSGAVGLSTDKFRDYSEVCELLHILQDLGGASIKKLDALLKYTSKDSRLRDSYIHAGAGQTYRTTGSGVQLQNLKRLNSIADVEAMLGVEYSPSHTWSEDTFTNTVIGENIRQVFKSTDPHGVLVVGDFSAVESRGLAYLAGADWKLDLYRKGVDLYAYQGGRMQGAPEDQGPKAVRTYGKVGELSCGYGAGPSAVRSFADGMGVSITEDQAADIVMGWREINVEIVAFWKVLDELLASAMNSSPSGCTHLIQTEGGTNYRLSLSTAPTLPSISSLHPGARDLQVELTDNTGFLSLPILHRMFRGVYRSGRNWHYHKATKKVNGPLWDDTFIDPKTGARKPYTIYGGKLAGILTQSFCREIFFEVMKDVEFKLNASSFNARLVGQLHDELVVELLPSTGSESLDALEKTRDTFTEMLTTWMSQPPHFAKDFPLVSEVNWSKRYTK